MARVLFLLLLALASVSCVSRPFYERVDGSGRILNAPSVIWKSPNTFVFEQDERHPFAFVRGNGELITPRPIYTTGGSVPRFIWAYNGFSPWDYAPAYVVHDWLYEAHRRKAPGGVGSDGQPKHYDRAEADLVMAEVIKTQMTDPRFKTIASPWHLHKIHWAVRKFGERAWHKKPVPVPGEETGPHVSPADLLPILPLLDRLGRNIGPVITPSKPPPPPPPKKKATPPRKRAN